MGCDQSVCHLIVYASIAVPLWVPCVASACRVVFFFFQAEDGIRDTSVTGVQTCALPIFIYIGGALKDLQGTTTITHDVWSHILAVNDGTDLKLYVNGVLDNTLSGGGGAIDSNTHNFVIGARADGTLPFDNFMDEVAVWNADKSSDVATIYNSGTPTTLPSGAVAHWRMGEEAIFTSNWLVNNSALSNYSTRSFNFDGVDDYVDCGNPTSLQITGALSISAWVKFTGNVAPIVSKYESGSAARPKSFGLEGDRSGSNNSPKFFIYNSGTIYETPTSVKVVDDGNWHHLLAVFNPSTYLRLYIDGNLEQENTTSIPATIDNDAADFVIGAIKSVGNPVTFFSGNIDEVAVWNSDQSANVATIYNSGTPANISSLSPISHWRMGEDATFSTNWSLPDNGSASNTGTSANMTIADLEGDAPNYTGGGLSNNMTIEDRVGDAPNSTNNALSYNMTESDRETDVPS